MFQRGTGERFKYKEAVKRVAPTAVCKSEVLYGYNHSSRLTHRLYAVYIEDKIYSEAARSAEEAWANAYSKLKEDGKILYRLRD